MKAATPCNAFPFGVPCWVVSALDAWVGTPVTPAWDFHFPFGGDGGNMHVDLALFDQYMPTIRGVLLAASLVAMAWFFGSLVMGWGASRGRDD